MKNKAEYYFKIAAELSPKRQEIFVEWTKTYFVINDYLKAKEKAQECIDLNPSMGECWQIKAISNIYLDNIEKARNDIRNVLEKSLNKADSKDFLFKIIPIYLEKENYKELIEIHEKLIQIEPTNPQYYAVLSYNYKVIGDYEKAKETAEKMFELFPKMPDEIKNEIEEFLRNL